VGITSRSTKRRTVSTICSCSGVRASTCRFHTFAGARQRCGDLYGRRIVPLDHRSCFVSRRVSSSSPRSWRCCGIPLGRAGGLRIEVSNSIASEGAPRRQGAAHVSRVVRMGQGRDEARDRRRTDADRLYRVYARRPSDRFRWFLALNYPDSDDADRAFEAGRIDADAWADIWVADRRGDAPLGTRRSARSSASRHRGGRTKSEAPQSRIGRTGASLSATATSTSSSR